MSNLDPLGVNVRLYNQISELLHTLENNPHLTFRERLAAVIAVGRIQIMFMGLRKEKINDPTSGSSVRKYAKEFEKAHDARGRKAITRSEPELDDADAAIQSVIDDAIGGDDDDERDTA